MDYTELAVEFIDNMETLRKARSYKCLNEALRGEEFILHFLYHKGGKAFPGEIRDEMGVSTARVAAALNNLEKKGLIARNVDANDRRKVPVYLTGQGEAIARELQAGLVRGTAEMLSLLGESDAAEYVRITGRLAAVAGEAGEHSSLNGK